MDKYNEIFIQGTAINLDDAALKDVKSVDDLPEHYFEHLYSEKKEEAEKDLLKALKDYRKKKKDDDADEKKQSNSKDPKVMGTGKTQAEIDAESNL